MPYLPHPEGGHPPPSLKCDHHGPLCLGRVRARLQASTVGFCPGEASSVGMAAVSEGEGCCWSRDSAAGPVDKVLMCAGCRLLGFLVR